MCLPISLPLGVLNLKKCSYNHFYCLLLQECRQVLTRQIRIMEVTRHPLIVGLTATLVIIPLLPIPRPKDGQGHLDTEVHPPMVVHLHPVQILDRLVHQDTHIIMVPDPGILDLDLEDPLVHPRRLQLLRPLLRVVHLHLQVVVHHHPMLGRLLDSLGHHQIKTLMDPLAHITISIR